MSTNAIIQKIEAEQIAAQVAKLKKPEPQPAMEPTTTASAYADAKPEITYDDFAKMDIRTGKIITAEKVEKADKLLKLTVDIGTEQRTIVSGIAEHFSPDAIIGQEVSVLINLAPRKLRGIESQGMILMAEDSAGKLSFVLASHMAPGMVIR